MSSIFVLLHLHARRSFFLSSPPLLSLPSPPFISFSCIAVSSSFSATRLPLPFGGGRVSTSSALFFILPYCLGVSDMNCFPCFSSWLSNGRDKTRLDSLSPSNRDGKDLNARQGGDDNVGNGSINAHAFTFHELATATKNFRQECLLGNGGFGRVYKGTLQSMDQVVAVKQLDRNGNQGNKEFLVEVLMLSLLHHPNLLDFIGYCAHGEQRLLVHEYMPQGSLEYHLHDMKREEKVMEWFTRMKIAVGAARGLEHLHVKANPPMIYRDLKSSNILLDSDFNPKLSDFGLANLGHNGDQKHVSSRVMGTYGYCAPEYVRTGKLTLHSDIYSFGVVILELITGRRALDTTRIIDDQNLVSWAQPMFKDPRRFHELVDPLLKSNFPERGLNQAVAIAAMCLQDEASARPLITDVVTALSFLAVPPKSDSDKEIGSPPRVMGEEDCCRKEGRGDSDEHVYRSESRRRWAEKVRSESSRKSESRSSSPSSSSTSIEEVQSEALFVSGEL